MAIASSPKMSTQQKDTATKKAASDNQDSSIPTIKKPEAADGDNKETAANAPLAPPPKPSQNGDNDYFGSTSHLSKEPNPFENAFGNPADTPGKTQLPGVTSLTSPASLLPANTPGWPGSLRSGPLSPAMLTGPTTSNDYFSGDHHFAGSFPTPNESSLRTGLTPGGGGSMFPQPSPNSQALYNQLQSGGATPGTLDFHRTAMTARAQSQANTYTMPQNGAVTSQPTQNPNIQPDLDSKTYNANAQENQDPFSSHQTNDAANGLFMLAQAGGQRNNQHSFAVPQQPQQYKNNQDELKREQKNSIGSNSTNDPQENGYSEDEVKPQTRSSRGRKTNPTAKAAANGKRKNDEPASKPAANKRQRSSIVEMDEMDEDDISESELNDPNIDTRKMTDEEKRKNFLERNRVAALKCRQRKKQWLANLQQKVEIFSTENDALAATVTQLREEIVGLKTLLLAHKDCPVSQAQGISSMAMQQLADNSQHYANPYGMGMSHGGQMQANMQRRSLRHGRSRHNESLIDELVDLLM